MTVVNGSHDDASDGDGDDDAGADESGHDDRRAVTYDYDRQELSEVLGIDFSGYMSVE